MVVKGALHDIEYAVRTDSTMPAKEFLQALKAGIWEQDPDATSLPSDAQISDYHKFLDACKQLATDGYPTHARQVNALNDGVWEFKQGSKRLSWYDTDGRGGYAPKVRYHDASESPYPDDIYWWFPDFDLVIRLGHAFPKIGARTESLDIDETLAVRKEDLSHDK